MKKISTVIFFIFILLSPVKSSAQWIDVTNNLPEFTGAMAIDAINSSTAIISISPPFETDFPYKPLFITNDSGNTWTNVAWPGESKDNMVVDISMIDINNIWIVTDDGRILRTTNGGTDWEKQYEDAGLVIFMNYIEMFDLSNGVAMGDPVDQVNGRAIFLTTSDGGQNWIFHLADIGGFSGDTWRRIDFINKGTGYFFESGINPQKLYKTDDGCQSWIEMNLDIYCSVVKAFDENIVIVGNSDYSPSTNFYMTIDGGLTWNVLPFNMSSWGFDIEFCPDDPAKVYYIGGNAVYFSSDSGYTWNLQIEVEGSDFQDIDIVDQYHGWVLDRGKVFRTSSGGVTDINDEQIETPSEFSLSQNYPNPFNPVTTIKYSIPFVETFCKTSLRVYDILGNEVATLVNETKEPGVYKVNFDASNLTSGVYIYKLTAGEFTQSRKLVLLK